MIKNYIVTAFRNFVRDKAYSFLNITGLAVGMTCSMLIGLYLWDELRYDNFHSTENLYRVALHRTFPATENYWATTPAPIAEVLTTEYPEVLKATRLFRIFGDVRVRRDDNINYERQLIAADSNFFDIFSIRLLKGNPREALNLRNAVVLTESTARRYFGDEDPLGKQLFIFSDTTSYMITGISEDVPSNCHFDYDFLLSFMTFPFSESNSWASYNAYNYVVLDRPEAKPVLEAKFPQLVEQYFGPEVERILGKRYDEYVAAGNRHYYHLQKVQDIHLHSNYQQELKANGDIRYIYLFAAVCFFILFVAAVNFTNLATARSFRRAMEIGIRKVHGSLRRQLIIQFLTESVIITAIAGALSLILVILLMDTFNAFTGKSIALTDLNFFAVGATFVALTLAVGVFAGVYPAFIVSSFQPISILKDKVQSGKNKSILRNLLVVVQFGVSVVLIVSTMVIYRQLHFMMDRKLGFDKERIIVIQRANLLGTQRHAFCEELRELPFVRSVGNSFSVPGRQFSGSTFQPIGSEATERINYSTCFADFHFPEALGLQLSAGRFFSEDIAGDSLGIMVNEAFVKRVGWKTPAEAIGERIRPVFNMDQPYEIIGVMKDFNFQSLHATVEPLAIYGSPPENFNSTFAIVRFEDGANAREVLNSISETWGRFRPDERMDYTFLDQEFDSLYTQEERFGKIFTFFSLLAVCIAAIGVVGLSTFMASRRTKEIGIRKINGASVLSLVFLLSREYLKLIVIANVVFWPVAWFGLNEWLSNYPYRTSLTAWIFLLTGLSTAAVVLLTVAWQSIKAATTNPVKSLRTE